MIFLRIRKPNWKWPKPLSIPAPADLKHIKSRIDFVFQIAEKNDLHGLRSIGSPCSDRARTRSAGKQPASLAAAKAALGLLREHQPAWDPPDAQRRSRVPASPLAPDCGWAVTGREPAS